MYVDHLLEFANLNVQWRRLALKFPPLSVDLPRLRQSGDNVELSPSVRLNAERLLRETYPLDFNLHAMVAT